MPSRSVAEAFNAKYAPAYLPVAIFLGGTSGLGQAMAEAFARYTKGRAHIVIVGRNQAAADKIIAGLTKPDPADSPESSGWKHEFVACDACLMSNVRSTCQSLIARLPRLNFLVVSSGIVSLSSTEDTAEGLDRQLALRYYSRYVFISSLLPLLSQTREKGEDVRVMSILAAGMASPITLDDFGIRKPREKRLGFTALKVVGASGTYNDMMMVHFARQYPTIGFTHIYPGLVATPALQVSFSKPFGKIACTINKLESEILVNPDECAEYMLYALFHGEKGVFFRNRKGEVIGSYVFDGTGETGDETKTGTINGAKIPGYAGSDEGVKLLIQHSEEVTQGKPLA